MIRVIFVGVFCFFLGLLVREKTIESDVYYAYKNDTEWRQVYLLQELLPEILESCDKGGAIKL